MPNHLHLVAASSPSPKRDIAQQPAGEARPAANQGERRVIRPAPPVLHRQVRESDLALNQLHHEAIEPSFIERVCLAVLIVMAVVSTYLVVSI